MSVCAGEKEDAAKKAPRGTAVADGFSRNSLRSLILMHRTANVKGTVQWKAKPTLSSFTPVSAHLF